VGDAWVNLGGLSGDGWAMGGAGECWMLGGKPGGGILEWVGGRVARWVGDTVFCDAHTHTHACTHS
jgi:hypothetical protein